jgi:hypothetical protein
MAVVYARCCGLASPTRPVVACLLTPGSGGKPAKAIRTVGTRTEEVLGLADWLAAAGGTPVALAATGGSWQPGWQRVEDRCSWRLANARHSKAVPGRTTDVRACAWVAGDPLGACGGLGCGRAAWSRPGRSGSGAS